MTILKTKHTGKYLKEKPKRKGCHKVSPIILVIIGAVIVLAIGLTYMIDQSQDCSVYQRLVRDGYAGTQEQWLASLVGEEADKEAESAYELAVEKGYMGSETEWIETLLGIREDNPSASPYTLACENGFEGSLAEWLTQLADEPEKLGRSNGEKQKTEYELACDYGYSGTFIEWLVSVTHDRVFE